MARRVLNRIIEILNLCQFSRSKFCSSKKVHFWCSQNNMKGRFSKNTVIKYIVLLSTISMSLVTAKPWWEVDSNIQGHIL